MMANALTPEPYLERDYDAIEAAVMETQRGRWFLEEYRRRNRNVDTLAVISQLDRIEGSLKRDRRAGPDVDRIRFDLADMIDAITQTKREIQQLRSTVDADGRFADASNELDAIVSQTETATGDILTNAEQIQEIAWTLREDGVTGEICDALDQHATEIYTACSFQDLTGQRTRKVVNVLKYLENRVKSMMQIWGLEDDGPIDWHDAPSVDPTDQRPDAHLLNGPQLAGRGMSQSAVDNLVVEMDKANAPAVNASAVNGGGEPSRWETAAVNAGQAAIEDDIDIIESVVPEPLTVAVPPVLRGENPVLIEDEPPAGDLRKADVFTAATAAESLYTAPPNPAHVTAAPAHAAPIPSVQVVGNVLVTSLIEPDIVVERPLQIVTAADPIAALTPAQRLALFG